MRNDNLFINNVQKYIMIMTGKWFKGFSNRTANVLYKAYSITFEWFFVLMTQQILISIIVYRNCPGTVVDLTCYYIQYTNSNICSFLSKTKSARKCFNYVIDYDSEMTSLSQTYLKYIRLNKFVTRFFVIFTFTIAIIWYILVVDSTYIVEESNNCIIKRGLNYQIWYPFDLYNKCFVITSILDKLLYLVVDLTHVYNKITPVSFLVFILGQLKILQKKLQTLEDTVFRSVEEQNIEYDEASLKEIVDCIKMHQEIIRFMHLVESACSKIVLVGFFTNTLELAAYTLYFLMQETLMGFIRISGVLVVILTQLFMTFWFANEILIESTAISDVIYYEINWSKFNKDAKQLLILMMMRAQKPLCVRLAAIGNMSINVFKRILKLCYSAITFFKTVYL